MEHHSQHEDTESVKLRKWDKKILKSPLLLFHHYAEDAAFADVTSGYALGFLVCSFTLLVTMLTVVPA